MNSILSPLFQGALALALSTVLAVQADVLVVSNTTVGPGDPVLDGQRVVVSGATLTLAGPHTFGGLVLSNNAVLTHLPAPSGQPDHALRLTVVGDVEIDPTSRIDANGQGYAEAGSPGFGGNGNFAGGGGGHGGRGRRSAGNPLNSGGPAFGSLLAPDSWGGPGGDGDSTESAVPGGGLVHLEVGGQLLIDGTIRAEGSGAWINNQGGGAGGTVYLKAGTLRGAGVISANGGAGEWVDGGGGAGGRIALFFGVNEFTGATTAYGAGGAGIGGAGTLFLKPVAAPLGEVRIQNGGSGEWTPITTPSSFNLVVGTNAIAYPPLPLALGTLTVKDGATLVQASGTTNLVVTASGNVVVESGGVLTADGRGYPFAEERGPGAGVQVSWGGSGAGHGGWGANGGSGGAGGLHYGSVLQPVLMGSQGGNADGGPGTAGGGAIRLDVAGTVTVNGRLSADGAGAPPNNAGGGSGGSIWITAHAVSGAGIIRANGGAGEWVDGGGGAGGRIALYYTQNEFSGILTTVGAGGSGIGGAGTIYTRGQSESQGLLFVGNGGSDGNYTALVSPEAYRVVLGGRANAYPEVPLTLAKLDLVGASRLTNLRGQTNLHIVVNGDVLIAADSTVNTDGRGYPLGEDPGPGAGQRTSWGGSGGGHGGWGGTSATGAPGGGAYGSILEPTMMGSQGGPSDGGAGTAGGGAIRLIVGGKLSVLGRLSANGGGNPVNNAGGGSGGSLWITAQTLIGDGIIQAQGGPGEWVDGGGGSGGRVALYFSTNNFSGVLTAHGGPARRGGAGTIYQRKLGSAFGQLLINNGGVWGNYTPLSSPEPFQVTLAENAYVFPETSLTVQDLEIHTNTSLTHLVGQARVELNVLHDLVVAEGGSLDVNGRGFQSDGERGPGGGGTAGSGGTGGGHGGVGGTSIWGGVGGGIYDSLTAPTERGSAGGLGDGGAGGAGGGAIRLVIGNSLKADGRITALGLNGTANNSGGGAGGSIHINASKLEGTGVILADGGAGEWVDGGGGAGGRIALHLGASTFTGTLFARGTGARPGGAGSIYTRTGTETGGELVLDNGGNNGALSPLEVPTGTRLVLSGGTFVYPPTPLSVVSLRLKPGATLTHPSGQATLAVQVEQDFVIESGAVVSVDGRGYPFNGDVGPGGGVQVSWGGSGGGHGGNGGVSATGAPGGAVNDSALQPVAWGSQGGSGDGGPGGPGGGAIQFAVGGTLDIAGVLTANGLNAPVNNSGGGAGGSIWIDAGRITGAGVLTANGGAGEWVDGGGGSGGRIALYLGTNNFTGTLSTYGRGGSQAGAAGTIYTRFDTDSTGQLLVDNGGTWGAYTPLTSPEPFHLTIANQAQVIPAKPLVVTTLSLETNTVLTHLIGQSAMQLVALGDVLINGAIDVSGRGYPWGENVGPGGGVQSSWAGSGAGHGGAGGRSATQIPGGPAYGSMLEPTSLGSRGGSGDGGPGGAGGGAIRLIAGGMLMVNGTIAANAERGAANNSGGGSGGSIFLGARTFTGTGSLSANGGTGEWVDGGGGAGGRIAVYRSKSEFTGTIAVNGAGGSATGENGTLHQAEAPMVIWLSPSEGWVDGVISLQVVSIGTASSPASMQFNQVRAGVVTPIATIAGTITAETQWNSLSAPDGAYELQVVVRDNVGRTLAEGTRRVMVNNAVVWHRGSLTGPATWSAGRIHVVDGDFVVGPTGELTLEPGAIVKFVSGGRLTLQSGAKVKAVGIPGRPVVLTSFLDDTVGGDSNLDGVESRPMPGAWRLALKADSTLEQNAHTVLKFHSQTFGGTLAGSQIWSGDSLREITETVVVPAGATLRIEAGAILKFAPDCGLDISSGGILIVAGTLAQPVVFTSMRDDGFGGDTNDDGARTRPGAGDWRSLRIQDGASATLDHALVLFGGNSVGNPWGAGGVIEALGGPLTARNCILADALKDGAFCYGTTRFENCLVLRCDRGLTAIGTMDIVNCTVDACRIGLLEHVGQLNVRNTVVSRSIDVGIEHDLGGGSAVVTYCNVWNPGARRGNYNGLADRNGRDGNISAAPRYKDPDNDNFRLNYASPGIDAAEGARAPVADLAGAPRYDDPRTGNSGTAAANGAVPDMGAYEFVESAPSSIDLVVSQVFGPGQIVAGGLVRVEWLIANRGAEPFAGPWHDALFLRNNTTGERLLVAEPLVGQGLEVAPGQSQRVGADVRVPGGVAANYEWLVAGNSRGDLFEGANAANNESQSGTSTALDVPEIVLDGGAVSASFGAQEQQQWFRCGVPAGKDVRVELDLGSSAGVTELYVGRGFMPTPENFTARQREFRSPDTTAIASGAVEATGETANTFYVLVVGRVLGEIPASFTLKAVSAAFTVESVVPAKVGNAGLVTLDIRGAGFATNTTFSVRSGAEVRQEIRRSARESGRVFATFNLAGFPPGPADLVADTGGLQVALPKAVDVVEGGTPDFYATLSGPGTTRAGRFMSWFITYGNRGLVDLKAPLLKFSVPGATEIKLYDNTLNWADSFTFWGLNPEVLLPTLGPSQEVTFEVRVKTMTAARVTVAMMTGEDFATSSTSFDWTGLPPTLGADPTAWAALVGGLNNRLGATLGDYQALLDKDLVGLAASELRYSYLANINGRWLFGDEPEGVSTDRPLNPVPANYQEPGIGPGLLHGPSAAPPGDGIHKTWWVVVSVEDYTTMTANDPIWNWRNLPGTRKDSTDLADYAKKDLRTPDDQYVSVHDKPGDGTEVRRQTMLNAIRSLKGKADADDNVVVVYSGHGALKPSGSPYIALNGDYMSPVALGQALDDVGAGTSYFLNDSCHSQAFNEGVNTANTTFVGFAGTETAKISHDTASGGELIKNLKGQLRKCRSLGLSMDLTEQLVTKKYEKEPDVEDQQHPVLTNPTGASLDGKPWNDPSGFYQRLGDTFRSPPYPGVVAGGTFIIVGSVDPNDKYALAGAGPQHWVNPAQTLPFQIVFENKTNAAAPAQEVLVTDDLDARFDWSTFELKNIAFNDAKITVPAGLQRFNATTKVGTDPYEVVVEVGLNPVTGRITWLMKSRDTVTGDLPEDPFAGFLPPNDATHRGEGSLSYTIRPKAGLPDGTQITNRATIVFDPTYGANPPIVTPWVTNTVDAVAPSSTVQPLPGTGIGEVPVQWIGSDAGGGSGIASYDIYTSRDTGPYLAWLLSTTNTTASFLGVPGASYRFYSVARDHAGNTEPAPAQPDAAIAIGGGVGPLSVAREGTSVRVTFSGVLQTAPTVRGPWTDVEGNPRSPMLVTPSGEGRFFRARR